MPRYFESSPLSLGIHLTPEEEFLSLSISHKTALNHKRLVDLYHQLGDQYAFLLSERNSITCIVAQSLIWSNLSLGSSWLDRLASNESLISEFMSELDSVAELFAVHDIPLIALKNSGIARGIYPNYGCSPMGDLDVLIPQDNFIQAHNLLIENEFQFIYRSQHEIASLDYALETGGSEYRKILPSGSVLWFELQCRSVSGRWIRPHQEPKSEELFSRSLKVQGSHVRILSPVDNLIQVCLHTAKHSYVRSPGFRLHTDVDRIVRGCTIDWHLFLKRVNSLNVRTATFFSLIFASDLLGTPVPQSVLRSLRPNILKLHVIRLWLMKVGLFEPNSPKWNRFTFPVFVGLLYDNFASLFASLFPSKDWLRRRFRSSFFPLNYLRYIINILFVRSMT
tara:strand:- start:3530 stop:4711 length:1182 start_codon:yes stop_codon:yes gene_type:complete